MLEKMSQRWSERMIENGVIERERAPLYAFGMEQGLRTLLELLFMLVIGFALGMFWQGVVMISAFCPIRMYAGGYHAKTPMQCAIKSWSMFTIFLLWQIYVQDTIWLQTAVILVVGFCLFFVCPLPDKNKPLQDYEIPKYRKRSFLLYGAEVFMYIVCIVMKCRATARSIVCGMGMLLVVWGVYIMKKGLYRCKN